MKLYVPEVFVCGNCTQVAIVAWQLGVIDALLCFFFIFFTKKWKILECQHCLEQLGTAYTQTVICISTTLFPSVATGYCF